VEGGGVGAVEEVAAAGELVGKAMGELDGEGGFADAAGAVEEGEAGEAAGFEGGGAEGFEIGGAAVEERVVTEGAGAAEAGEAGAVDALVEGREEVLVRMRGGRGEGGAEVEELAAAEGLDPVRGARGTGGGEEIGDVLDEDGGDAFEGEAVAGLGLEGAEELGLGEGAGEVGGGDAGEEDRGLGDMATDGCLPVGHAFERAGVEEDGERLAGVGEVVALEVLEEDANAVVVVVGVGVREEDVGGFSRHQWGELLGF